mgnify:CR=1 FL=1
MRQGAAHLGTGASEFDLDERQSAVTSRLRHHGLETQRLQTSGRTGVRSAIAVPTA